MELGNPADKIKYQETQLMDCENESCLVLLKKNNKHEHPIMQQSTKWIHDCEISKKLNDQLTPHEYDMIDFARLMAILLCNIV